MNSDRHRMLRAWSAEKDRKGEGRGAEHTTCDLRSSFFPNRKPGLRPSQHRARAPNQIGQISGWKILPVVVGKAAGSLGEVALQAGLGS